VDTGLAAFAAANQAESRIQQSAPCRRLQKQWRKCPPNRLKTASKTGFDLGISGQDAVTKYLIRARFRGFVLNAPLSSAISH
jgi:hypothetical protein